MTGAAATGFQPAGAAFMTAQTFGGTQSSIPSAVGSSGTATGTGIQLAQLPGSTGAYPSGLFGAGSNGPPHGQVQSHSFGVPGFGLGSMGQGQMAQASGSGFMSNPMTAPPWPTGSPTAAHLNPLAQPFNPQGMGGYGPMPGAPGFVPGGPYGAQPHSQIPGYAAMSASGFGMPLVVSPPQPDWETAWVAFCREKLTAPGAAVLAHSVYQILAGLGCDKALILSFAEGEYMWSADQQANAIIKSFVQYLRAQMGSHRLIKELDGGRLEIVSAGGIKEIRNLDGTSDVAVNDILDSAFETYKRNGKFSEPVS